MGRFSIYGDISLVFCCAVWGDGRMDGRLLSYSRGANAGGDGPRSEEGVLRGRLGSSTRSHAPCAGFRGSCRNLCWDVLDVNYVVTFEILGIGPEQSEGQVVTR